jgi:protein-S-isoprenylcysteine O-methyltransferase Ste14
MVSWSRIARRIRVPLGFAFTILFLWLAHPTRASLLTGFGIAAIGLIIRALASGHVRKNEQLTTSGPYAHLRNPLYFGSLILAGGFAVAALSWWIVAVMILFFLSIYLPVIRAEEDFLRRQFPEFDEYARQVPRLIPRLRPFGNVNGAFSWDLYWKHREYNAAVGVVVLMLALTAKMVWWHGG